MSLSFQNVATVAAVAVVAVASLLSRSSKLKKGGMPFSSYRTVAKSLILLSPFDEGLPSEKLGVHFDVKTEPLEVGDLVGIIPNHACGTVNMWSKALVVRNNRITAEWSITARH